MATNHLFNYSMSLEPNTTSKSQAHAPYEVKLSLDVRVAFFADLFAQLFGTTFLKQLGLKTFLKISSTVFNLPRVTGAADGGVCLSALLCKVVLLPRAQGLAPLLIAGKALTLLFPGASSHGQVAEVLVALVLPHLAQSTQCELELLWLVQAVRCTPGLAIIRLLICQQRSALTGRWLATEGLGKQHWAVSNVLGRVHLRARQCLVAPQKLSPLCPHGS